MTVTEWEPLHSNTGAGIKYRGLKNLGSTCYLNSVLQVLFMTPKFRAAVERFDGTYTTFIDAELKDLFRQLTTCSPTTEHVIRKLQIDNVHEQRDAAEYLERILRLTRPEASEVFHGELTHRRECSQCKEGSDDHGSFWTLNLGMNIVLKKVYDVRDGLEAFFSQSQLTGDNQLYCDTCQAKEDSIIECIFKKPPQVLVVLLKRFEFSYDIMGYVKNNSPVNVLLNIEIPKGRSYELYATVDHCGDLSGGHYTATIKSPDDADSWYNFDDSSVTRKDNFNPDWSRSAYLLFYRHRVCDVSWGATRDVSPVSPVQQHASQVPPDHRDRSPVSPVPCHTRLETRDRRDASRAHRDRLPVSPVPCHTRRGTRDPPDASRDHRDRSPVSPVPWDPRRVQQDTSRDPRDTRRGTRDPRDTRRGTRDPRDTRRGTRDPRDASRDHRDRSPVSPVPWDTRRVQQDKVNSTRVRRDTLRVPWVTRPTSRDPRDTRRGTRVPRDASHDHQVASRVPRDASRDRSPVSPVPRNTSRVPGTRRVYPMTRDVSPVTRDMSPVAQPSHLCRPTCPRLLLILLAVILVLLVFLLLLFLLK